MDTRLCDGVHALAEGCDLLAIESTFLDEDEELVTVLDENPPESDRAHVYAAVQACPVLALTLEG